MLTKVSLLSVLVSAASAGTTLWDGRFNDMTSSSDLEKWSFSNPVGAYQYYIHGPGAVTDYVNLDPTFKNPADASSKQGVKITIDETAKWNGQSMLRTELIPQTTAAINKGKVYYHFSVKTAAENAPLAANEHQVAFFESHFTELKTGGAAGNKLQWHVGGTSKWEAELVADEWHNVAYEIDFDGGAVTLWHSTGSAALSKTAGPFDASTQSNGADWHLGVLRLPGASDAPGAEDWYFSGVYVESGEVTTAVGAGSDAGAEEPIAAPIASSAAAVVASPTPVAEASSSAVAVVETPAASSSAVIQAPVASSTPIASSTPAAVETPSASPTPVASSAPIATPNIPASGSNATLPEEFTIRQFVAWLKAKQGMN